MLAVFCLCNNNDNVISISFRLKIKFPLISWRANRHDSGKKKVALKDHNSWEQVARSKNEMRSICYIAGKK